MGIFAGFSLFCCLSLGWFSNPLIYFEKKLDQPIYFIKNIFNPNTIQPKSEYKIVLIGDSMTASLGNSDELKSYLHDHYPDKKILIDNYGFGATNILSVTDRLQKATDVQGQIYPAILDTASDLILIESFGNNPLSEFSLAEGLEKQNEALDRIVKVIKESRPQSLVVFVATIPPYRQRYGETAVNLSTEERIKWADERIAYIKNHIKYALDHKITLINIYTSALDSKEVNHQDLISTNDFIHPSPTGILYISKQIADFIYYHRLLPL